MFALVDGFGSDSLGELRRAIDQVAADAVVDLAELRRLMDRLEGVWLHHVGAAEHAGAPSHPRMNPAGLLAQQCRMPYGAALADVKAARVLDALPKVAAGLMDGSVPPAHVRVLVRACTLERLDAFAQLDEQLAIVARDGTTRDLQRIVRNLTDALDHGGAADANALHDRRKLHVSRSLAGVGFVDGHLDPEGTEIVLSALEHRMGADPDLDTDPSRSRPQQRADAIVDICRHYLRTSDAEAPTGARRGQPHISGVVNIELLERHARARFAEHNDLDFGGPVSAETWRRLTCDCSIHRIVMRGRSELLDVGRLTRTVPAPLWRALVARDQHCTHPGCTAPPAWCEAHHITHWADGGPTNLANLTLLCWRHHRQHHEGHARAGP